MGPNVLAIVLAGGQGERLRPLTSACCKPALPFTAGHRIIDFVLSNLVNSGIQSIYVLAQYRSESLVEYLDRWRMTGTSRGLITAVTPRPTRGPGSFHGTADAVFQNLDLIEAADADLVAVFAADHVYRMDVRQVIGFHLAQAAQATVITLPVPLGQCSRFGIVETGDDARVRRFHEKPHSAQPMPGSRTHARASMGNYLFHADVLVAALRRMHASGGCDFGHDVLPSLVEGHKLVAYDFATNEVPGTQPYEERSYWRDVGTIDAYYASLMDTWGDRPKFRLENPAWPIRPLPADLHAPAGSPNQSVATVP